jgi:F-type H+-transporting ATPase subunit epsilon
MAVPLQVEIVTPARRVLSLACEEVYLPAVRGEMGVLPEHAAFVGELATGPVRIRTGSEWRRLAVRGGFVQVTANRVILLADDAAEPAEIDRKKLDDERAALESKLLDVAVSVDERTELLGARDWIDARSAVAA